MIRDYCFLPYRAFAGDFNVVLGVDECRCARIPARGPSSEFKAFTNKANLIHLQTRGDVYTWSNRRRDDSWNKEEIDCPMSILSQKLKNLKNEFKVWNVEIFGNVHQMVKFAMAVVDSIQNYISDIGPNEEVLEEERLAKSSLLQALSTEEEFWKQKSRLEWHMNGDRNTSFFHRITKIRQISKSLSMLKNGDTMLTDQNAIASYVLDYFTNLLDAPYSTSSNDLIQLVIPKSL
ncbi:PREDICTED: uncharacterized protein LOC109325854 [Lupinus angustifolius]|uniref:uncharacterized protein LOC109325854 n=1 Tax=Lupinus angustifolius TaxID=3871 RepID=UPI00092F27BB|nr:PREDICTED: uncharacterized protein LOC109325854 [Lupinus angustifolius]